MVDKKPKNHTTPPIVKVVGIWELGYNVPLLEYDIWTYMLRDFCVDQWYMAPITGIDRDVTEIPSIEKVVELNPDLTVVLVDEHGETPLAKFVHPRNTLYIFGKANQGPSAGREGDISVRIETPTGSRGMLWPHQAAAIVLYDRQVKSWQ